MPCNLSCRWAQKPHCSCLEFQFFTNTTLSASEINLALHTGHQPVSQPRQWADANPVPWAFISSLCSPTSYAVVWIFVFLEKLRCWNLTFKVMVLGPRVFGRWSNQEDRVLMNGICARMKVSWEIPLAPSTTWGHSKKLAVCNPEESSTKTWPPSCWTFCLYNCCL